MGGAMLPLPLLRRQSRRPAQQAGFGLIETIVGVSVLALAMLGYISTTLSHQRLAEDAASRIEARQVAREFLERMRGDSEWPTLYQRLRAKQIQASVAGLTGTHLDDGRIAFAPTSYYPDMDLPLTLDSMVVLVDVPYAPDATATNVLREDVVNTAYGLPADLNGDGLIDDKAHDDDCVALPVVVTFRWTPRGESAREMRISTALRGER